MAERSRFVPGRGLLVATFLGLLICAAAVLPASGSPSSRAGAERGQVLLPPAGDRMYLAANPGFGGSEDIVSAERIRSFEQMSGRPIAWAYFSNNWLRGVNFPAADVDAAYEAGTLPFVRLMARSRWRQGARDPRYSLQSIIDGDWDGPRRHSQGLRSWCRQAAALDRPLLAEFGTEANGDWFPWNGRWNGGPRTDGYGDPAEPDGPERFRDAYRHIVSLCRREGAENITWFFHANADSQPQKPWNRPAAYYPGRRWVDWIGISFYGSLSSRWRWERLRDGLDRVYPELSALAERGDKPMALLEWGTREDRTMPGRKARWIADAATDLESRWPALDAAAWWSEAYSDRGERIDLRIDSSRGSLRAYRALVSSESFATEPRFTSR